MIALLVVMYEVICHCYRTLFKRARALLLYAGAGYLEGFSEEEGFHLVHGTGVDYGVDVFDRGIALFHLGVFLKRLSGNV